ncbi:DUF1998 domain-containing protein [Aquimarina megaterium]|uniref:DUF1998 domain-containing protein n=1 Tax=Aquimarina megaterium TaxID=1443666 RepID=UPI00094440E0|nr:DUF1998 domain-containing protein [Aquimarina megaterium]
MGQFEQIQTRKAISAYGGVGSIIETRDGSILIRSFNEWPFFQAVNGEFEEHNLIKDKRFKNRLSRYFQELENLVRIPINDLEQGYRLPRGNEHKVLSAKYFPEWFYCNNCHKFDKIDSWLYNWRNNVETYHKENFHPPKCYSCYVKNRDKKRKFYDLEQVRFILTAPNGDVADIPWDKWAMLKQHQRQQKEDGNKENESSEEVVSLSSINVPEDLILEYKTSDKLDDLKGIWIIAKNQQGEQLNFTTLSGLFNLRIKIQELFTNSNEIDIPFKPVIRSSNSVYYPNILSSIYVPANDELNEFTINLIKQLSEAGSNATQISQNLKILKGIELDVNIIQNLIENDFDVKDFIISQTENEYRYDEYKFILENERSDRKDELVFEKINNEYFQSELIKSIYKMDKIKITSVQTSYTRQEPISADSFLKDNEIDNENKEIIRKKFTSKKDKDARYLPAIESFGEGIFFDFEDDKLKDWINSNPLIQERVSKIIDNHNNLDSNFNDSLLLTPKYILLHTFSHLIIKELEYLCGYPATSIQERLYIDNDLKMNGILIYTIAGSEGSYGGLTSICDDSKIGKLIKSAMIRANDCATDPICYHTTGQGVSHLNLSACFSCTLLPETSCEMFNCYLDRRILIDKDYGYFKGI